MARLRGLETGLEALQASQALMLVRVVPRGRQVRGWGQQSIVRWALPPPACNHIRAGHALPVCAALGNSLKPCVPQLPPEGDSGVRASSELKRSGARSPLIRGGRFRGPPRRPGTAGSARSTLWLPCASLPTIKFSS